MKNTEKLMRLIADMRPVEFLGLANLLGAPVMEEVNPDATDPKERYKPKSFTDVFEDVLRRFDKLNRSKKREILRLVEKSNSKKRKKNAGNS